MCICLFIGQYSFIKRQIIFRLPFGSLFSTENNFVYSTELSLVKARLYFLHPFVISLDNILSKFKGRSNRFRNISIFDPFYACQWCSLCSRFLHLYIILLLAQFELKYFETTWVSDRIFTIKWYLFLVLTLSHNSLCWCLIRNNIDLEPYVYVGVSYWFKFINCQISKKILSEKLLVTWFHL